MAESKAKIGTFDELIEITRDAMRPIARRLREIILDIHPEPARSRVSVTVPPPMASAPRR